MDSKTDLARDEVGQQADAGEHGLGDYAVLTQPAAAEWPAVATGHARWEKSAPVAPREQWDAVSQALLRWEDKTRSGSQCTRAYLSPRDSGPVRGNNPSFCSFSPWEST